MGVLARIDERQKKRGSSRSKTGEKDGRKTGKNEKKDRKRKKETEKKKSQVSNGPFPALLEFDPSPSPARPGSPSAKHHRPSPRLRRDPNRRTGKHQSQRDMRALGQRGGV